MVADRSTDRRRVWSGRGLRWHCHIIVDRLPENPFRYRPLVHLDAYVACHGTVL